MTLSPLGFNRTTGRFETIAASSGPGLQFGPRTAYTSSGTKTVATETPWVPPSGWALWGFRVIAIGAGGGAGTSGGGSGGNRVERVVSWAEMGSPSTITITVGAGANSADGGHSAFGSIVRAEGGRANSATSLAYAHPDEYLKPIIFPREGMNGEGYGTTTQNGAHSPTGLRGGGGGGYNGSGVPGFGGNAFPRSYRGFVEASAPAASELRGASSTSGIRGVGVGDWPGDGGYGENGFFPGGGGGCAGSYGDTPTRGGHGVVIVYPIFQKAV